MRSGVKSAAADHPRHLRLLLDILFSVAAYLGEVETLRLARSLQFLELLLNLCSKKMSPAEDSFCPLPQRACIGRAFLGD
jgi:hypothetical protein